MEVKHEVQCTERARGRKAVIMAVGKACKASFSSAPGLEERTFDSPLWILNREDFNFCG